MDEQQSASRPGKEAQQCRSQNKSRNAMRGGIRKTTRKAPWRGRRGQPTHSATGAEAISALTTG
eukprot:6095943-Alexandrium_andersonii.AAC.1